MDKPDWGQRYERFWTARTMAKTVRNAVVHPRWIPGTDSFWYDHDTADGAVYFRVDAASGERRKLFESNNLITALAGQGYGSTNAPEIRYLDIDFDADCARFDAAGRHWRYTMSGEGLENLGPAVGRTHSPAPDGSSEIRKRDGNLYVRGGPNSAERLLTTDGVEDFAYGEIPTPMRLLVEQPPQGLWSPDSTRFFTVQVDERHVEPLYWIEYCPPHQRRPMLHAHRQALPGERPPEFNFVIIDVASGAQTRVPAPVLPSVRMNDTPLAAEMAWWSDDGRSIFLFGLDRCERAVRLYRIDADSGHSQVLFVEEQDYCIELGSSIYGPVIVAPLPASNEVIYFSERTGNGHLYLLDTSSGCEIRAVTSGDWRVRDLLHVDPGRREVMFSAAGLDKDPYLAKVCVANLDTGQMWIVSGSPGDHVVWRRNEHRLLSHSCLNSDPNLVSSVSPSGNYFVETVGAVDALPVTVLRNRAGKQICELERASIDRMPENWTWPSRVKLKAADGVTDLYGVLFSPANQEPGERYPLIDIVYGGPQLSVVPTSAFADGDMLEGYVRGAGYAALGAFALLLDGRGVTGRDRLFRQQSAGALQTTSNLEDHVAAITTLSKDHPIDLERIGVTGFSGGGYLAAQAALRFGHFYKVAAAASGNYDQAVFWQVWGEHYQGPYTEDAYAPQAAKTYADGLTGKLLLLHGLVDKGVHPQGMFQLLQSLIDADRDPDLVLIPSGAHAVDRYAQKRILDYFRTHLFGEN
jgi:dipeptidyl aminopeptidase/acylaminoacyl peptidase